MDGRPRAGPRAVAGALDRASAGCGARRARRARSSRTAAGPRRAWPTRAGRTRWDAVMHASGALPCGADRAGRGPGLQVRGAARRRRGAGRARRDAGGPRRCDAGARRAAGTVRARVLAARTRRSMRSPLDGERRAVRGGQLESRPLPVEGRRRRRARRGAWPSACCADDMFIGLGPPHAVRRERLVQPDELPQRLGVASRHRDRRRRAPALRPRRRRSWPWPPASSRRRWSGRTRGCPSSSAASRGRPGSGRRAIPSRARPRRGRRACRCPSARADAGPRARRAARTG